MLVAGEEFREMSDHDYDRNAITDAFTHFTGVEMLAVSFEESLSWRLVWTTVVVTSV